jgi:VanZ family protein
VSVQVLFLWAPVAIYMAAIFFVSADPTPPVPASVSDKLLHLIAYAVLALLVYRAAAGGIAERVTWRLAAVTLLITIGYGIADEVHQLSVPNRSADVKDLYADAAGAAIALIACWAWGIIQVPKPKSQNPNPKTTSPR